MGKKERQGRRKGERERGGERVAHGKRAVYLFERYGSLFLLSRWSPVARARPVNIKGCTCLQQHCVRYIATCLRRGPVVHRARALQLSPLARKMDISRKSTHSNADRDYLS